MAMGDNEQGFMTGGLAGAGVGASIGAPFAPVTAGGSVAAGAAIGFIAGGLIGNSSADSQRRAKNDAIKKAERLRRESVMKELGAKQQADNIALAGLSQNKSTPKSSSTAQQAPGGFIGAGTTTSAGTF